MSRTSERYLPFAVAVVAGGAAAGAVALTDAQPFSRFVPVGTMTLGVVVAGFTATQRNMLLGMGGTKVLHYAATTGYYKDVLDYLAHCIYAALFVTVVSVPGMFLDGSSWGWSLWLALWVGSVFLVIGLMVRNEWLMSRIFTHFMKEQKHRNNVSAAPPEDQ